MNWRLCDSNRLLSVLDHGVSVARGGFPTSDDVALHDGKSRRA